MFIIEKTTLGLEILLQAKREKSQKAQTTIAISYSIINTLSLYYDKSEYRITKYWCSLYIIYEFYHA